MPLREAMAAYLVPQLDFIYFFYGLAFILLGAVCYSIARARGFQSSATLLGLFGLVHGVSEWLDLIAVTAADSPEFANARTAVMAISFLFLMEFARGKAVAAGHKPPGRWLYLALVSVVIVAGVAGGVTTAHALARYMIGFPAAMLASLILFKGVKELPVAARHFSMLAVVSLALYGVAAGAIVPAAPFWPASTFDCEWFMRLTGIPIQLVRGLLACTLAFSLWAVWGKMLIVEVSSDRYTEHVRRQFIWTLTAMATVLVLGFILTQLFGGIYARNVEASGRGEINLLASRLTDETAIVDGMVRILATFPSLVPLLSGAAGEDDKRARSILDLDVKVSGARYGAILDASGAVVASSGRVDGRDARPWGSASWFRQSLAGEPGSHFEFDPADGGRYYFTSYPVRRADGSIAGVAFLQKSLDRLEADLKLLVRAYFLLDPDGIVVLTNRPEQMLRAAWPLPADRKSALTTQLEALNDAPMLEREPMDATWIMLDGRENFVRRVPASQSRWSIMLAVPKSRMYASRITGIVITLLVTMMALFYLFGREHGIRDRIQMDKRAELQELARHLRLKATTDPLTGLYNRAKFDESLSSETARSDRYKSPLALIMFDVDHFKRVNDLFGHQTGDNVLVRLSKIVAGHIRDTDLLARWGGEEFVILAPGLDGRNAYQAAEKLKAVLAEITFDTVGAITCSFGVAQFFEGDTSETLVMRADKALYLAKMNGRNRSELASEPGAADVASVA